jgi:ATP-dependent Clp protease ATP-binding subunit ClpX
VKQFAKLFQLEKIDLEFDDDALRHIAKRAIERKTGARGLRGILEKTLLPTQFALAELRDEGVIKVRISKDVINGLEDPILIKEYTELLKTG